MRRKTKRYTRRYTWVDPKNIGKLNLQRYIGKFNEVIGAVLSSNYDTFVSVGKDDFVIDTAMPLSPSQAIQICKGLAKVKAIGALCREYNYVNNGHCKQIFKGTDISA